MAAVANRSYKPLISWNCFARIGKLLKMKFSLQLSSLIFGKEFATILLKLVEKFKNFNEKRSTKCRTVHKSKPEIAPGSSLKLATLPRRGSVLWSQSHPPTHSVLQNEEMCYFILFPSTFAETYKLRLMFTTTTRIPNTVCG